MPCFCNLQYAPRPDDLRRAASETRPERRIPNRTERHRSRRLALTTFLRDTVSRSAISNVPRHQSNAQRKIVDCIQFEQLILPDLCQMAPPGSRIWLLQERHSNG